MRAGSQNASRWWYQTARPGADTGALAFPITNGARDAGLNAAGDHQIRLSGFDGADRRNRWPQTRPHRRLMVVPGTLWGPANSVAIWATLRLSSPALVGAMNHHQSECQVELRFTAQ